MKKIYSSALLILAALTGLQAQQGGPTTKGYYTQAVSARTGGEQHSAERNPAAPTVQYSNDVIIENAATFDQRRVRISVAFNGWLYAAYSTVDNATGNGGITLRMSRDNGITWTTMDSYSVPNVQYSALDIVVAGTDTNNLVLYNCAVNHNTSSNSYVLFVDRYNATTGSFNGSNLNLQYGSRPVYDVAIASDYRYPAVNASPYSVGILYSCYSSSYDSINFIGSIDGGATFGVTYNVATTGGYNHAVSLAYGRSASASNGRYFGAWEQLGSSNARTGHIYTSHSTSTVDGAWITPVNVDSVSSTMINLCKNPQIAVQYNSTDNDSGSCTAVILVQRDYIGDGSDYDLLGFYNKRAHFTNFWNRLDIVNSGENDLQPDVSYDPTNNNFLAVYYDSTNGKLPYLVNGMNLTSPSTWTTISAQYNDVTTNLKAAYPRVEINPVVTQTAHAWIADSGTNGVAMFDAEYNVTSVNSIANESIRKIYPNPSSSVINLEYTLKGNDQAVITIYDMLGAVVETRQPNAQGLGNYTEQFDVSNWSNGVYTVTINTNGHTSSARVVVAHQ